MQDQSGTRKASMKSTLTFMAILSALLAGCVGYEQPIYRGDQGRYEQRQRGDGDRQDQRGDGERGQRGDRERRGRGGNSDD
jgi:hypothetical protein